MGMLGGDKIVRSAHGQVFKRDLEEMEEYWDLNLIILNLLPLHFMIC